MKKSILVLAFLPLLYNGKCQKSGKKCHTSIVIINNSVQNIICATRASYGGGNNCNVQGNEILKTESYKFNLRTCWEDNLPFECYIIDPVKYNAVNVFYSCDSIEIYNKVLKHYVLTVDDLRATNFIVTYP